MSILNRDREYGFNKNAAEIEIKLHLPSDFVFKIKDQDVKLSSLKCYLSYDEAYEKLYDNATLDDMVTHFFEDFLLNNQKKILAHMIYGRAYNRDKEVRAMLWEVNDFITIMLQSLYMD